jgi:hypothetical protein
MPELSSNRSVSPRSDRDNSSLTSNACSVESLAVHSREAFWELSRLLQCKTRIPVFALVGTNNEELTKIVLALCAAEGGSYISLSNYVGQVVSDPNFRDEWVTDYYLAEVVMDLANTCQTSFLVVDDWEIVLALVRHDHSNAHLITLTTLAYQTVLKPTILVLPLGQDGFENAEEVRDRLEIGGSKRVVALVDDTSQQNQ